MPAKEACPSLPAGCGRDGRRRMAALVNSRAAARLLGSASLRGDAVGRRGASSHADLFWARMRDESGRAEGARVCSASWRAGAQTRDRRQPAGAGVYASRGDNGASDSRTLPEYSPRPARDGGGRRAATGTPTQDAACACGVGSSGHLDATGCACGTGPAAAGAAAGLERMS